MKKLWWVDCCWLIADGVNVGSICDVLLRCTYVPYIVVFQVSGISTHPHSTTGGISPL